MVSGFFWRSHTETIFYEADLEESSNVFWHWRIPLEVPPRIRLRADILANDLSLETWGGTSLSIAVFSTPECQNSWFGLTTAPFLAVRSDMKSIKIESESQVLFSTYLLGKCGEVKGNGEPGGTTLKIWQPQSLRIYSELWGLKDRPFRLTVEIGDEKREFSAKFGDIPGPVKLSYPPQYSDTDRIIFVLVDSKVTKSIPPICNLTGDLAKDLPGVRMFALGKFFVKLALPVGLVVVQETSGKLRFGDRVRSVLAPEALYAEFTGGRPGELKVNSEKKQIRLEGKATKLIIDNENMMPRQIDKWKWYMQAIIWSGLSGIFPYVWRTVKNLFF